MQTGTAITADSYARQQYPNRHEITLRSQAGHHVRRSAIGPKGAVAKCRADRRIVWARLAPRDISGSFAPLTASHGDPTRSMTLPPPSTAPTTEFSPPPSVITGVLFPYPRRPRRSRRHSAAADAARPWSALYLLHGGSSGVPEIRRRIWYERESVFDVWVPEVTPVRIRRVAAERDNPTDIERSSRLVAADGYHLNGGEALLDVVSIELPPADYDRIQAALRRAFRARTGLHVSVSGWSAADGPLSAEIGLWGSGRWTRRSSNWRDLKALVDGYLVAHAMRAATRLAGDGYNEFPPLRAPKDWKQSQAHVAARLIAEQIARRARGVPNAETIIGRRVPTAMQFLLSARAGGLGRPLEDDGEAGSGRASSVLVGKDLPANVIAEGGNPVTDPRTALAYRVSIDGELLGRLYPDDFYAMSRLEEVPELISTYVRTPWLRYGPLSATLARAAVALERVQFQEHVMKTPLSLLDGAFGDLGESWSYRASRAGRRAWPVWLFAVAQATLFRALTTLVLGVVLVWADVPHAGWIVAAWLFFGSRIKLALFGEREKNERARLGEVLQHMRSAERALLGDHVAVAVMRQVLVTSAGHGVVWPRELWDLLGDAERRREMSWRASPRG